MRNVTYVREEAESIDNTRSTVRCILDPKHLAAGRQAALRH